MHERSLVRSLLRQVQALAAEHPADRVDAIRVRIGEFSGVEPELLESAYEEMAAPTSLCGAELVVQCVPLEVTCDQCGKSFAVEDYRFQCPDCGSLRLTICGGEELLLESISMEEAET
jgi:hydrogenase nickel incorporation protein HypA/HybF